MDYRSMDTEALDRMLLDSIHELEQQKLVDHHFRQCHSLKEDNGLSFFLDLILIFLNDAEATMSEMAEIMYQEVVDFNKIYSYYIKLKGSSACFGACRIKAACSNLRHAIDNKSKEGCLEALSLMKDEHKNLHDQLNSIIKIEEELFSRAMG
ncbi:histidine-containing phosphotransfer protein 2-like isoform X1 [Salvia miltiorrhiza]|uniref:histidine-containing phosphotransfer protein 2-like isoform X1 n=1 Tax=Salvia miltiorrhiza TaxID=226208 RepID=UPI0025ABEF5A|nr:histidine-containing phosphotransfer protein 2-like isoform X1 [Salvia miltiorrhiza]